MFFHKVQGKSTLVRNLIHNLSDYLQAPLPSRVLVLLKFEHDIDPELEKKNVHYHIWTDDQNQRETISDFVEAKLTKWRRKDQNSDPYLVVLDDLQLGVYLIRLYCLFHISFI